MVTPNALRRRLLAGTAASWLTAGLPVLARAAAPLQIAPAAGVFEFVDQRGDPDRRIAVYTYLPAGLDLAAARIVFVMHGASRNADAYRNSWILAAERHRFLVLAPLFDREQWGPGGYSYSSVMSGPGRLRDRAQWSFSVIEHLFDAVRAATGNRSERYWLYGHSEGGQFVHRLVLLLPEARYARAVAANPGWYTMPDFDPAYPYGLRGAPVTPDTLRASLGRELIVLLGDQDIDPEHHQLRRTPEAMAQGAHRFERGHRFVAAGRERAAALGAAFGWRLETVPGVAHQNRWMAGPAADLLMK